MIPVVTLLVGGWLIVKTLSEQGPRATISFKTAEGIEVDKTKVKYKNVDIGVVDKIEFSDDFSHTILTVDFIQGSEKFLRRSTRFWVVKPQLSLRGASGGPRVTFIVGMPRSGTTLVESILARHPEVTTIGESRALARHLP